MADDILISTQASGETATATIAADEIASKKYQRIKLVLGADGVNDGDVSGANPVPVDGSGVTQPVSGSVTVSGTVTANAGTGTLAVSAASLPLPTGASTAANQSTGNSSLSSIDGKITACNTGAVIIASGSLTANAGTNLNTSALAIESGGNLAAIKAKTDNLDVAASTLATAANQSTANSSLSSIDGKITACNTGAVVISSGSVTATGSGTFTTKEVRSATPTQSSVAGSASSVQLLASNANRLGATIYNDSTAQLKVKLGATASSTSFTVALSQDDYYEVPYAYTGAVDGIWASATGNARITELAS